MMYQVLQHFMHYVLRNPPAPLRILILLGTVLVYGMTGFLYWELPTNPELNWSDGLWYSIVTMTTVGYGDFFPKTTGGRFFVGGPVMLFGIGLLGYALSVVAAALVSSKTKEIRGMSSYVESGHLVVINYPGLPKVSQVLDELAHDPSFGKHTAVVLVDEHLEELPPELAKRGVHYVRGNPVRDTTLARASVDSARYVVILARNASDPASDNLNVTIALAVEAREGEVKTVVECVDPASEELLKKAGCDRIVCSSRFDAYFLSQELLNPGVQEVIDDILSVRDGQQIYFIPVSEERRFQDIAALCRQRGHLAMGASTSEGIHLNLGDERVLRKGDRVITLGPSRIDAL
ncbi:MAG: TrkA family potassium uptake protein [Syntrophobacteraceae bacterium]